MADTDPSEAFSSITIRVTQFERWVDEWDEYNCRVEPDIEGCVFGEDSGGNPLLLECHGKERPRPPPSPGGGQGL